MPDQTHSWNQITHYAGFDWAKHHHHVVIVDQHGTVLTELTFDHTGEGWAKWKSTLSAYPHLAVAIETNQGAAIKQLLDCAVTVYPVNPLSAERYRDRKVPSGTKTDYLDAWSLADALRLDGHGWRPLKPLDPLIQELRLLCRDEVQLIEKRTELVNQLQAALHEYYPAALQAFDDWTASSSWSFVVQFPTPELLHKAGKRKWETFLHTHRLYRPETGPKRLEIFAHAHEFTSGPAVTRAKSRLAVTLVKLLQALEAQLQAYRKEIERLFAQHPDHDLFGSLPGAGAKLAPRAAERDWCGPLALPKRSIPAMLRWNRPGELPIRPDPQSISAPPMQQSAAACGTSLGRLKSPLLPLGPNVLPGTPKPWQEPRQRLALPGSTLAKDPLENVAAAHPLRLRTPRPQPTQTRLLDSES